MAANSHIEWTEATWNPVTGCNYCYARDITPRWPAVAHLNRITPPGMSALTDAHTRRPLGW